MSDTLGENWEQFFERYYSEVINELANIYPEERSLTVRFADIDNFNPDLADMLLTDPDGVIPYAIKVLRTRDLPNGVILEKANVRIEGLQIDTKIKAIWSEDGNKLVSIRGIVTKVTDARPKLVMGAFECPFCHHVFVKSQNSQQFSEPYECPQEDGGCGRRGQKFSLVGDKSKFIIAQTITLQEPPEELRGGEMPQSVKVSLEDDLAGKVYPGDLVTIIGVVRLIQAYTQSGKSLTFDVYVDANSLSKLEKGFEEIEITPDDEKAIEKLKNDPNIYDKLIESIAPSIYGNKEIKEALALQLFGGVQKILPDGTRLRGDLHILLIGDPGLAKSQFLVYSTSIAPRGVFVAGGGSSGVGLTASAIHDKATGRWNLEAGVLVLADKGIAAVDELEKMREEERDKIHTALEQQVVNIAKAGINATLNARCGLLASANPKHGRFDSYSSYAEQINLPPTLLSRFDLIFTMRDIPNENTDKQVSGHILGAYTYGNSVNGGDDRFNPTISNELFRKYIAVAKRIKPQLTDEASTKIRDFYVGIRHDYGDGDSLPLTARQLQALIRLATAVARARLSKEITEGDADQAIKLLNYCLKTTYTDPETGKVDVDWIHAGVSGAERQRRRIIESCIHDLEQEYGKEIPVVEILDAAERGGVEREKAESIISEMKCAGKLFSPDSLVVRYVP